MSDDPMTTATAEMFMRQRDEAQAEVERLREALRTVADHIPNHSDPGGWKHWATLAAEALEASSEPPS